MSDVREKLCVSESKRYLSSAWAKVKNVGDVDLTGHDAPLEDTCRECLGIIELVIDEVPVGLDHDAVGWASEVEDLEGATGTPASAGGAGLQLLPTQRGVSLERSPHSDRVEVRDSGEQVAVLHMAPAWRRSMASSTSS